MPLSGNVDQERSPTSKIHQSSSSSSSAPPQKNSGSGPFFHSVESPASYSGPSPFVGGRGGSGASGKMRRQSRFDPMMRDEEDEEVEDEGYGELGGKHPLRREQVAEGSGVSLPGIRALFGVAEHPPTPSSSVPPGLFHTPSLSSLASPSSSPSTIRTSRYSSLGSSFSTVSDSHGWWAPDFDRSSVPILPAPNHRAHSFPIQPFFDERDTKRRRSDLPPSMRDPEEEARLKWQAQSRNASLPTFGPALHGSISGPSGGGGGLRSLIHPPAASAAMSRGSLSAAPGITSPTEHPFDRRPSAAPRSASLVGGQLVRSFADLSAADPGTGSPRGDMAPPSVLPTPPDRRFSLFPAPPGMDDRSPLPSTSRSGHTTPLVDRSHTRPSSPDPTPRSIIRRSSLTEMIMARSGDDIALATGRFNDTPHGHPTEGASAKLRAISVDMDKPSLSEPLWTNYSRRTSADSTHSADIGVSLNSGDEKHPAPFINRRGKKRRPPVMSQEIHMDEDMSSGFTGMQVLAESARRVAEEEEEHRRGLGHAEIPQPDDDDGDDDEGDVDKTLGTGSLAGPKYVCTYCAKTFSRPSSLRIHTYSHTGERPYVCKEPSCRRRFSVQSNLKRHAKVHQLSNEKAASATSISNNAVFPNAAPNRSHSSQPMPSGRSTVHPPGKRTGQAIHPPPIQGGYYNCPTHSYHPNEQGYNNSGRLGAFYSNVPPGRRLSSVGEAFSEPNQRRAGKEEDWSEEEVDELEEVEDG